MHIAQLPQQLLNGIFSGSIYALVALGYTLVFGVLDILNLAHAAIFMTKTQRRKERKGPQRGCRWLGCYAH